MEEAPPDRTGQLIGGRYRITGPLGAGAMADVYQAIDETTQSSVAVKLLKEDISDRSTYHDRFEREVLITSKLSHPTCIRVLDFGTMARGLPYQIMELVPGRQLADVLDECESMLPARALHILKQLLHALAACGDAGIVHRDLKPENILLYESDGDPDCVKLIDFGIAKLIGEAAVGHQELTSVGLILGTPHYIAPEWITKDSVDGRADLYSATIMLFEMLTSAPPFLSEDRRALMKMHLRQRPPTLKERMPTGNFSDGLEAMVRMGLAKEPADRFSDARAYLNALKALSGEVLSNEELKVPSQDPTAIQPHLAQLPPGPMGGRLPAAPGALGTPSAQRGGRAPKRRVPPLAIAAALIGIVALLVVVSRLDGKGGPKGSYGVDNSATSGDADLVDEPDTGAADRPEKVNETQPPKEIEPMRDAEMAVATDAFREAGLEVVDFDNDLEDKRANGACRYGKVDGVGVLLCTLAGDPVKTHKAVRRKVGNDSLKWRARIRRGQLHLRVEDVGKKDKRTRRKIERVFKALNT